MARQKTCLALILVLACCRLLMAQEDASDWKQVALEGLTLKIPAEWQQGDAASRFRIAEFTVSDGQDASQTAELVIFDFGGPTGGIHSNIERWIGQFQENGRELALRRGKWKDGAYYIVDVSGTWKKPIGPPIAGKTKDQPGSRVIGVILIAQTADAERYFFLKLSGPDQLVKRHAQTLRTIFGADVASETQFELEAAAAADS